MPTCPECGEPSVRSLQLPEGAARKLSDSGELRAQAVCKSGHIYQVVAADCRTKRIEVSET